MNYFGLLNFRRFLSLLVREHFSKECEKAINKQINLELKACHNYLAMAFHFDRSDVAAPGVFKFFNDASHEERKHAEMFMEYMNKRGGTIIVQGIEAPKAKIETAKDGMIEALNMEKEVNQPPVVGTPPAVPIPKCPEVHKMTRLSRKTGQL